MGALDHELVASPIACFMETCWAAAVEEHVDDVDGDSPTFPLFLTHCNDTPPRTQSIDTSRQINDGLVFDHSNSNPKSPTLYNRLVSWHRERRQGSEASEVDLAAVDGFEQTKLPIIVVEPCDFSPSLPYSPAQTSASSLYFHHSRAPTSTQSPPQESSELPFRHSSTARISDSPPRPVRTTESRRCKLVEAYTKQDSLAFWDPHFPTRDAKDSVHYAPARPRLATIPTKAEGWKGRKSRRGLFPCLSI